MGTRTPGWHRKALRCHVVDSVTWNKCLVSLGSSFFVKHSSPTCPVYLIIYKNVNYSCHRDLKDCIPPPGLSLLTPPPQGGWHRADCLGLLRLLQQATRAWVADQHRKFVFRGCWEGQGHLVSDEARVPILGWLSSGCVLTWQKG